MESLIAQNQKAARAKDLVDRPRTDPLSEDDVVDPEIDGEPLGEEGGSAEQTSGVDAALVKLTSILQLLTDDKQKKATASKLDLALDGASGASSELTLQGTGKKAAAARKALRSAYIERPEQISQLIEKHMYEDLNSQVLPPGLPPRGLNERAWVEHRSRISNYKASVYCSWSTAAVLDDLINGRYHMARARAGVLLLMLGQASIDRGSWTLAGELSLENPPPFSAYANHPQQWPMERVPTAVCWTAGGQR